MVLREQYCGSLKKEATKDAIEEALRTARRETEESVRQGKLLTASVYRRGRMCFVYYEALIKGVFPEDFLGALTPCMELWPEEVGMTPWAYMYHIYHHSIPEEASGWEKNRMEKKTRIGRIAYLWPEKLFSYTYWHKAIVDEGLLKGDQYQCIALHENILFSYFEEPKTMVNIRQNDGQESEVIREWMNMDPESHFDRKKAGGDNFIIIDPVLSVGRGDL